MWKLNNTCLKNQCIKKEIKKEIRKYLETNKNENIKHQNLKDKAKRVLKQTFMAIKAYVEKEQNFQINNLTLQLEALEKEKKKLSQS